MARARKNKVEWFPEELAAGKPPDRIKISGWSGKYRVLGKHSAIKGPYQLAMVPFFVPVMDFCQNPEIDEIVCCAPSQIGKTDCFLNVIGFYTDQDPSSVMVVLADEATGKYVNTEKIQVMFKESEHLSRLYDPRSFNKSEIDLPNGAYIAIGWASSVALMATRSIRIMYLDEIDKPGYSLTTKEANALSLARERTNTYPAGYFKHIFSSTPTIPSGNIITELESCDIIYDWHVPCPFCGQYQILRWSLDPNHAYGFKDGLYRADDGTMHKYGQVVWEGGRKSTKQQIFETARYQCGECGELWTTGQKNEAVRQGKIVSRADPTGFERKIGFHINRIYSLFDGGRLDRLVMNWVGIFRLAGEKMRKALQGFINSTLAEPWIQVLLKTSAMRILQAKCNLPPQTVPQEAVSISAGIDVQLHGFWFVVRAWARDYCSWLIHYGNLATYEDVETLLFDTAYPVQGGNGDTMRIWRAAIDIGGGKKYENMSMTEETIWWLRKNSIGRGCRVRGTKGSSHPLPGKIKIGKPLDKTPSGKPLKTGLQIIQLDTDELKDMYHDRIRVAIEGGQVRAAYLHKDTGDDYSRQILAEEKRLNEKGGQEWFQLRADNHLLDCEIMAMACAEPEWPGGGVHLIRRPEKDQKNANPSPVVRSKWMGGGDR